MEDHISKPFPNVKASWPEPTGSIGVAKQNEIVRDPPSFSLTGVGAVRCNPGVTEVVMFDAAKSRVDVLQDVVFDCNVIYNS